MKFYQLYLVGCAWEASGSDLILLFVARNGESSTRVTQATQRKEESTEESTRYKEGKSWSWQKGTPLNL